MHAGARALTAAVRVVPTVLAVRANQFAETSGLVVASFAKVAAASNTPVILTGVSGMAPVAAVDTITVFLARGTGHGGSSSSSSRRKSGRGSSGGGSVKDFGS